MNTLKRVAFARAYALSGNATQAAIEAGYSPRTAKQQGSRLLTFVDVRAEVARLESEQQEAEKVDRQYVLNGLRQLAENAESEAARVRALELLGKSLRMFVEPVEVHASYDVSHLEKFSVSELHGMLALAREQQAIQGEVTVLDG